MINCCPCDWTAAAVDVVKLVLLTSSQTKWVLCACTCVCAALLEKGQKSSRFFSLSTLNLYSSCQEQQI